MPEQVTLLLVDADWILTMDSERRVIKHGAVAINGDKIVAVGPTAEIVHQYQAPAVRSLKGRLVMPGLIDGHIHSSFQLSRGLADEVGSQKFLFQRMYPYEGYLTPEQSYWSTALCALEELRHGVTCMIDPGNYSPDETVQALSASGIRAVIAKSAMDIAKSSFGSLPATFIETTEEALQHSEAVVKKFHQSENGRIRVSLSFRGVNNASDDLISRMQQMAHHYQIGFQAHACFAKETRDSSVGGTGYTEVERLHRLGVLGPNLLLIHMGWATPGELLLLRDHDVKIVAAPSSSFHNGYGNVAMGKIPELLAMGVSVGLGSDHASSGIVDLVQEMRMAAGGYKEVRMDAAIMPPETVVEMATLHGARCAWWEDEIGSLVPGKKADLAIFDTRRPEWQPLYNPVANLVYSATGSSVDMVLVNGRIVVDQGRVLTLNADDIYDNVERVMPKILEQTGLAGLAKSRWPISG
ncbi:MAG: amidohydrolase family protein [Sulfobacillus sp.]